MSSSGGGADGEIFSVYNSRNKVGSSHKFHISDIINKKVAC